jgi:hypothetical protein
VSGVAACGAIAVIVAINIAVDLILHNSYQNVMLYNLTPYKLTWSTPYFKQGLMNISPGDTGTTTQIFTFDAMHEITPGPGLEPIMVAQSGQYSMVSGSTSNGISWVMDVTFTDPSTNVVVANAAVLFDIPFSGDNSLYASFGEVTDNSTYFSTYANQYKQVQYVANNSSPAMTATVTFDYLSGQHPGPSGQEQYWYNSLIVFQTPPPAPPTS